MASARLSQVFHCLNEILELCHSFCSLVSQNLGPLDDRGTAQLDILVKVGSARSAYALLHFSIAMDTCWHRRFSLTGIKAQIMILSHFLFLFPRASVGSLSCSSRSCQASGITR